MLCTHLFDYQCAARVFLRHCKTSNFGEEEPLFHICHSVGIIENRAETTNLSINMWVFAKIGVPQNGWFIRENPIRIDDLRGKPTIFGNTHITSRPVDVCCLGPSHWPPVACGGWLQAPMPWAKPVLSDRRLHKNPTSKAVKLGKHRVSGRLVSCQEMKCWFSVKNQIILRFWSRRALVLKMSFWSLGFWDSQ